MIDYNPDAERDMVFALLRAFPYLIYCNPDDREELINLMVSLVHAYSVSDMSSLKRYIATMDMGRSEVELSTQDELSVHRLSVILLGQKAVLEDISNRMDILESRIKGLKPQVRSLDKVKLSPAKGENEKVELGNTTETLEQEPVKGENGTVDYSEVPELFGKPQYTKVIIWHLKKTGQPLTIGEIAEQTGIPYDRASKSMSNILTGKAHHVSRMKVERMSMFKGKPSKRKYTAYYIDDQNGRQSSPGHERLPD